MKKRVISCLLAVFILVGVLSVGALPVSAESDFRASDECIELLKREEGFSRKPYWDYAQYTVGYGTCCPSDMVDYYLQNGITEEEAETLLRNHMAAIEKEINKRIVDKYHLNLTQSQFDAILLFSYNVGTGWTYETTGTFFNAIINSATGNDLIRAFALWCSAGGEIKTGLIRRRLMEANMYLNGIYSSDVPENYCYVIYDANGGVSSPRSQGYDSDLTAAPYPVPTYSGHVFDGWYTAKTGGQKVTVLDASLSGKTLYAHWKNGSGNTTTEPEKSVTVTVTGMDVNLRKGPGTNYAVVGTADKGEQFVITETASGSGYKWGKFNGGWICLTYTNYDTVIKDQTTKPAPEPEEPDTTEPTEPEPTEPKPTEPKPTEPKPTEPEATQPTPKPENNKVMGTIKVNEWLRVRSGPSTSYSIVKYLYPNDRVEILEKKTVGSTTWAKIADGWISMDYVVLDSTSSGTTTTESITGTVKVSDFLRVRSGPGTSYAVAGYLKPNEKVTITERKTVGSTQWGKISSGWISLDYVVMDSQSGSGNTGSSGNTSTTQPQKQTKTVTADCLCVRKDAGTSNAIVSYLYYGAKVEITETKTVGGTQWGKIAGGWICMDYTK